MEQARTHHQHGELTVTAVELAGGYRLVLTFSDGVRKLVDLEQELWGEAFEPLRDLALFAQVRVNPESGTLEWPNEADLDPDTLYTWGHSID